MKKLFFISLFILISMNLNASQAKDSIWLLGKYSAALRQTDDTLGTSKGDITVATIDNQKVVLQPESIGFSDLTNLISNKSLGKPTGEISTSSELASGMWLIGNYKVKVLDDNKRGLASSDIVIAKVGGKQVILEQQTLNMGSNIGNLKEALTNLISNFTGGSNPIIETTTIQN